MRILFLSDNFPPEVNAPASRTFEHCREWVKAGHEVTVVTCAPNFPQGVLYAGYRNRLWQWEEMGGIRVLRVWSYIAANEGIAKRSVDFLSFMVTSFLAGLVLRRPDVIVGTSPQLLTNCSAWMLSVFRWRPFVFELRDLYPESLVAVGLLKEGRWLRLLEGLELFLYRRAAAVVPVTVSFRENLIRRGIAAAKIHVVTNGADLSRFHPLPPDDALRAHLGLTGRFVVGYVGTHGMAHALGTLVKAAERLRVVPAGRQVQFVLLGDGAEKARLKAAAVSLGLDNVLFLDTVPKEEVPRYWSLLDVSIIHLRKDHKFTQVIPSKLFECMGMGIPVLHGVAGESAEIVQQAGMGLVFEAENVDQLTADILRLSQDPALYQQLRTQALAAAHHYQRQDLAQRMLGVLAGVVRGRGV